MEKVSPILDYLKVDMAFRHVTIYRVFRTTVLACKTESKLLSCVWYYLLMPRLPLVRIC